MSFKHEHNEDEIIRRLVISESAVEIMEALMLVMVWRNGGQVTIKSDELRHVANTYGLEKHTAVDGTLTLKAAIK